MLATAGNRLCVSSSRSVAVWAACPVGRPYTDQHLGDEAYYEWCMETLENAHAALKDVV
jgi:hypothetical protein